MKITILNAYSKTYIFLAILSLLLTGCSLKLFTPKVTDMLSIALCRTDKQAKNTENSIVAEYGFKRFAKNTYRPIIDKYLFGHEIRVIEINPKKNKIYVAGNPREIKHHFHWFIDKITCNKKSCQASIDKNKVLRIHKINYKKIKNTTIIECNKN